MKGGDDTERLKLELEKDKLEFEKEKFREDRARRAEELLKLRVDIENAQLETKDLLVPYKERAAYKTAIFQGRAAVIGALVALLSLLALKPLYDAFQAKLEATQARQEMALVAARADEERKAELAQEKQVAALKQRKTELDGAVASARQQLTELRKGAETAKRQAALMPIDGILNNVVRHPQDDPRFSLRAALDIPDGLRQEKESYLAGIAADQSRPVAVRAYITMLLYQLASKRETSLSETEKALARQRLISLLLDSNLIDPDDPNHAMGWLGKLEGLIGIDTVAMYTCSLYST